MTRLLLLNGLPGVGKSTLAARLGVDGWYVVDPDRLRATGLDPGAAWDLAAEQEDAALRGGRDVVAAQLVSRVEHLPRFAGAATRTGAGFLHVLLTDPGGSMTAAARLTDHPARADLRGADGDRVLARYRVGLAEVARLPGVRTVVVTPGDPDTTYAALRDVISSAGFETGP